MGPGHVLAKIQQHVDETAAHFLWRAEGAGVVATAPHAPAPLQNLVHRTRRADREAAQASGEGRLAFRLDQQVHMIRLHGEMQDAKPRSPRTRERPTHDKEHRLPAQARQASRRAQGHVDRVTFVVFWSRAMGDPGPSRLGPATRPFALTAPSAERKLLLPRAAHS
jgi:hypothetical protein